MQSSPAYFVFETYKMASTYTSDQICQALRDENRGYVMCIFPHVAYHFLMRDSKWYVGMDKTWCDVTTVNVSVPEEILEAGRRHMEVFSSEEE